MACGMSHKMTYDLKPRHKAGDNLLKGPRDIFGTRVHIRNRARHTRCSADWIMIDSLTTRSGVGRLQKHDSINWSAHEAGVVETLCTFSSKRTRNGAL